MSQARLFWQHSNIEKSLQKDSSSVTLHDQIQKSVKQGMRILFSHTAAQHAVQYPDQYVQNSVIRKFY